jgi:hypothetical protein
MGKKPPLAHDHSNQDLNMGKKPPLAHDHSNQNLNAGKKPPFSHGNSEHDLKGGPKKDCDVCGKSTAGKPHKSGDRDRFCPPHENGTTHFSMNLHFGFCLFRLAFLKKEI